MTVPEGSLLEAQVKKSAASDLNSQITGILEDVHKHVHSLSSFDLPSNQTCTVLDFCRILNLQKNCGIHLITLLSGQHKRSTHNNSTTDFAMLTVNWYAYRLKTYAENIPRDGSPSTPYQVHMLNPVRLNPMCLSNALRRVVDLRAVFKNNFQSSTRASEFN